MTNKPVMHFAHANGVPSAVYQKLFDHLSDDYEVVSIPLIGTNPKYPISNHWPYLVQQVIDSIESQASGQRVIGLGHSLGSALTFMAAMQRPDLFQQVIMLDPPLIMGKDGLTLHLSKMFSAKILDRITPAGLSLRRRDHWESRAQAAELLRPKGFYRDFDAECFDAYIEHALQDDPRGGVTLTIPKNAEVEIFRTNPSLWWLPQKKLSMPAHLVVGQESIFLQRKFPQMVEKKWDIPFSITPGGHMFPLEHPVEVAQLIKQLIRQPH
ncbi:alpha/beta fold hydrolase [Acinetobacter sp. CAAS 2-6]|uniref:alpha/beta fold hydrolase n=1 Tax=Acinetobacter sp. CAAS 2-6 TaxID=3016358 RepID=UPI002DD62BCF|nr:alpha/beta hydrolase [Acinetobacter sp. CAAS 2-6]